MVATMRFFPQAKFCFWRVEMTSNRPLVTHCKGLKDRYGPVGPCGRSVRGYWGRVRPAARREWVASRSRRQARGTARSPRGEDRGDPQRGNPPGGIGPLPVGYGGASREGRRRFGGGTSSIQRGLIHHWIVSRTASGEAPRDHRPQLPRSTDPVPHFGWKNGRSWKRGRAFYVLHVRAAGLGFSGRLCGDQGL
jgi:hypothetical protein